MFNSATPWTVEAQTTLSSIISQSLLKFMFTGLMMLSNHLILCYPLLFLLSIFSSIRVFSKKLVLRIRWPKYWRFSFSISPSNEYSGLISFKIDWSDLLAVQGTLRSLIQHHNSKASILRCSAFFKFFALNLSVFLSVTHVIYKQQIFFEKQAGNPFFFPVVFNMLVITGLLVYLGAVCILLRMFDLSFYAFCCFNLPCLPFFEINQVLFHFSLHKSLSFTR